MPLTLRAAIIMFLSVALPQAAATSCPADGASSDDIQLFCFYLLNGTPINCKPSGATCAPTVVQNKKTFPLEEGFCGAPGDFPACPS
ncbi:hypothetical protein LZ30DRAFT_732057 [Colletotrichum cereale]|nr:hypothetical protein LZ30DRAFT_732057 [Colletotrichum cereale]